MALKNWVLHRYRQDGGDDSNADAEPQYEEVTSTNGLPVQIVGPVSELVPSVAAVALQSHPITQVTAKLEKATPGAVRHFFVTNENATKRWFNLHNKATLPVAAEVPLQTWTIPGGTATNPGYVEFTFSPGAPFDVGIGWSISTARGVFTNSATASEHEVHIEVV